MTSSTSPDSCGRPAPRGLGSRDGATLPGLGVEPCHIIPFGKHKARSIKELVASDPDYLKWLAGRVVVSRAAPGAAQGDCI